MGGEGAKPGATASIATVPEIRHRSSKCPPELVSAVWDHMDTWGIAGRGMYWRPVLSIHVGPGAEGRYDDLKTLLQESGLKVEEGKK